MSNRLGIFFQEAARGLILVTVALAGGVESLFLEVVGVLAGSLLA